MTKQLIIRAAATTALALSLAGGMAAADASVSNTGPSSQNSVSSHVDNDQSVNNNNNLGLNNGNRQGANSGSADVRHNTTGNDAQTGDATNDNTLTVNATVDNSGSSASMAGAMSDPSDMGGSIDTTGPNSNNRIESSVNNDVRVNNNNNVNLNNNNYQAASSGSANVSDNTTGGGAKTGDASNSNTGTFTLDVTN